MARWLRTATRRPALGLPPDIAQVYVAIHAAADARELWIVADDEGRAKQLYERLGFRHAWTAIETLRLP